jgi:hypothetical protein
MVTKYVAKKEQGNEPEAKEIQKEVDIITNNGKVEVEEANRLAREGQKLNGLQSITKL